MSPSPSPNPVPRQAPRLAFLTTNFPCSKMAGCPNIANSYSGLTDVEIRELTQYFPDTTTEDRRVSSAMSTHQRPRSPPSTMFHRSTRHDSGFGRPSLPPNRAFAARQTGRRHRYLALVREIFDSQPLETQLVRFISRNCLYLRSAVQPAIEFPHRLSLSETAIYVLSATLANRIRVYKIMRPGPKHKQQLLPSPF